MSSRPPALAQTSRTGCMALVSVFCDVSRWIRMTGLPSGHGTSRRTSVKRRSPKSQRGHLAQIFVFHHSDLSFTRHKGHKVTFKKLHRCFNIFDRGMAIIVDSEYHDCASVFCLACNVQYFYRSDRYQNLLSTLPYLFLILLLTSWTGVANPGFVCSRS